MSELSSERYFRQILSQKVGGIFTGLWFLVAEHLRLGSWDLIKTFTKGSGRDIESHIAMQVVNEAALCSNRIRKSNYIAHQGFELLNGLGILATDQHVHKLLDAHSVADSIELQQALALSRYSRGHYIGNCIAIDPHRIKSTSQRVMPMKKKNPDASASKMLQTFFSLCTDTGQPIACGIGSAGENTTKATIELLESTAKVCQKGLVLADKEHFTNNLFERIAQTGHFDLLVPTIASERIRKIEQSLHYTRKWAGYAIAETMFNFQGHSPKYRLICQREGEDEKKYKYCSFLTLSDKPAADLLSIDYPKRWTVEEFFNFDGPMGFDRASTHNLNVRLGKMSLALMAQAASYEFRRRLPQPYQKWNALHLADAIFSSIDGDIRVKDDTIIVTCYKAPQQLNLQQNYQNLPQRLTSEGIDPRIPWLYDFKLDFRFK